MTAPSCSMPITYVHPRRCVLRYPIRAGEVRRHPMPSCPNRAFAYDVGCPACGIRNIMFASIPGVAPIVEGELVEERPHVDDEEDRSEVPTLAPFRRPKTLSTGRDMRCVGCSRSLTIADSTISAA